MSHSRSAVRSAGFTLVEVMVAVVVICVGLLGVAKLEALAMSNMSTSRLRSLAAIEAASLAASMHSNRNYWASTAPATVTIDPTAAPIIQSSDGVLAAQATADYSATLNNVSMCNGTSNGASMCQPMNLAAFDLARWSSVMLGLLPNPVATISCPAVVNNTPTACTVQITWSETAVSVNSQEAADQVANAANSTFEKPSYLLYVEP
jgi:type IV pilus assembly protein PilV